MASRVPPEAIRAAVREARKFVGATAPNPPVGACAWDAKGQIVGVAAHERAGQAHAEAKLIAQLRESGQLQKVAGIYVTLEPCNHFGRMPPCTHAIDQAGIAFVAYGVVDPNPKVEGGGAAFLASAGIEVARVPDADCDELIRPFHKRVTAGEPWIVVKQAITVEGSMIPPHGQKTFTSESSIRQAHLLRKESDAILTGAGTILTDQPEFSVRAIADHGGKSRCVAIIESRSESQRVSQRPALEVWSERARERHLEAVFYASPKAALEGLKLTDALQILVEAGPRLTAWFEESGNWDEWIRFRQGAGGEADQVERRLGKGVGG